MHRIDSAGATIDNKFTDGDPATGVPATLVVAAWLNTIQEELAKTIEGAGLVLDLPEAETNTQLLAAIAALRTAAFSGANQSKVSNGYQKLPGGLIVQWGGWSSGIFTAGKATVGYPIAWPNGLLRIALTDVAASVATVHGVSFDTGTLTTFDIWAADNAGVATATAGHYIAIGY